ncbi:RIP metalloprotease RseP [Chromatiales bacterium (ex Bugula neritina AB1)]|nr:RIP metalloprotease RseP [Chromatiales bacterium (ex Bugula neritina AB1)]
MQGFLLSLVAFILAIGILVTVHEFGHYWVAKKMGVKVLRFSIGFGKPLWKRISGADPTEYVLAAIPLGGYVKMLDEREGDVAANELDRAFNRKSVWARSAIVLAGPLANLILAVLVYWIVFIVGITGIAPILGAPLPGSAAEEAGFTEGDKIVRIAEMPTPTWDTAFVALLDNIVENSEVLEVTVETDAGATIHRRLPINSRELLADQGDLIAKLGLQRWWPTVDPVVGGIEPGGAAEAAGLRAGDRVISSDGQPVETWADWVRIIRASPEKTLQIELLRDSSTLIVPLTPRLLQREDLSIGFIGARETQSQKLIDEKLRTVERYSPGTAFYKAIQRTGNMISVSLGMIGKLFTGEVSLKNTVSGPISIAQFAGQSVSVGVDHYLSFIALVSISLGIFNLFPVPMLDGGHLVYFAIEAVTGKPVSERIQIYGQQVGLLLLAGLMTFVFYQDILRILPS